MNCKFFHTLLKQFVPKSGNVFLVMICTIEAIGQSNTSGYSDAAKQRLLIRITAHYIHTISQGQIDMDSAVRIPCKVYGLSPFLAYNEGYYKGQPSIGARLLDAGQVREARTSLLKLQGENRLSY